MLLTGAGPIGCLVVAALRHAGAAEVVVSDLLDAPLELARKVGATSVVRADNQDDWPAEEDLAIGASGAAAGLRACVERVRRAGTVVLLGLLPPGETGFLGNVVVTREINLVGAFRFDSEFDEALAPLAGGLPVDPVISHTFRWTRPVRRSTSRATAGTPRRSCSTCADHRDSGRRDTRTCCLAVSLLRGRPCSASEFRMTWNNVGSVSIFWPECNRGVATGQADNLPAAQCEESERRHMESGHLLEIGRLTRFQFLELLETAAVMNTSPARRWGNLTGKVVGAIFEKPSTRTRASTAAAAARLGMQVVFLSAAEMQTSRGETWQDTGRVLSCYFDLLVLRTFRHSRVCELAAASSVPVINALTDDHHPCQALADVLTIQEHFGELAGVEVAFVGDARSNVWRSLAEAVALCGMSMVVASPAGYEPDPLVLQAINVVAAEHGGSVRVVRDPVEAVSAADVIYPEVWVPMGLEHERAQRVADLAAYRVDEALFAMAKPTAVLMHCLPAFRGEEVTSPVLDGPRSLAWRQAANRLSTTQSVMHGLLATQAGLQSRTPIG